MSLVFLRKLLALVEGHLQRGVVGLQQHVRHDTLSLQFGVLAGVARVLVAPMYHQGQP